MPYMCAAELISHVRCSDRVYRQTEVMKNATAKLSPKYNNETKVGMMALAKSAIGK